MVNHVASLDVLINVYLVDEHALALSTDCVEHDFFGSYTVSEGDGCVGRGAEFALACFFQTDYGILVHALYGNL